MKSKNAKYAKKSKKDEFKSTRNFEKPKFKGKDYNDQSWYNKNSQLTIDTATLPFNHSMTDKVPLFAPSSDHQNQGLPIVMSVGHDWLIGDPDVISTAGRIIWADIRKHNSGATNYQGQDVISLIVGIADVFINATWLSQFFGLARYFNGRSRVMPKILFSSANIDYDDFIQNLADYRARFNTLLLKARTLTIPKKYPWIDAAMSMYGKLFKDEDTDTGREQLYIVNKAAFYMYDPSSATGTMIRPVMLSDMFGSAFTDLKYYPNTDSKMGTSIDMADCAISGTSAPKLMSVQGQVMQNPLAKFKLYLDILEKQIMAIIEDEDANIIQGDLLKAFGDQQAYTTGQIDESYEIKPTYSEEFGILLHNSLIMRSPAGTAYDNNQYRCDTLGGYDRNLAPKGYLKSIKQDPAHNKFSIILNYDTMSIYNNERWTGFRPAIDSNKYSPSPEDNIWLTRMVNWNWFPTNDENKVISNGVFINLVVWRTITEAQSPYKAMIDGKTIWSLHDRLSTDADPFIENQFYLTGFKWKPLLYKLQSHSGLSFANIVGECNNVIVPDFYTLAKINEIVLLSLWDIPQR